VAPQHIGIAAESSDRMTEIAKIEASLDKVGADLVRARGLVGDAIKKLFTTFDSLRTHLAEERKRYEQAISAISGDSGLVAVIREVLGGFVGDIVRLSQSSVRILVEVDALRERAEQVASRGLRIEKIAQTTRVLSLNARIEAQRVGTSGAAFRVVAEEIKALAGESGQLSEAIRHAISEQAVSLEVTHRAASELAATDLDLAVESHKRLDATIARLATVSQTSSAALDRIQRDIDVAIQALQFEDMLDQLLAAIGRKVLAIRNVIGAVSAGGSAGDLQAEVERDVVTQHDVSSGSVELF
jgi:methyl-accepting chemotaxis protein